MYFLNLIKFSWLACFYLRDFPTRVPFFVENIATRDKRLRFFLNRSISIWLKPTRIYRRWSRTKSESIISTGCSWRTEKNRRNVAILLLFFMLSTAGNIFDVRKLQSGMKTYGNSTKCCCFARQVILKCQCRFPTKMFQCYCSMLVKCSSTESLILNNICTESTTKYSQR